MNLRTRVPALLVLGLAACGGGGGDPNTTGGGLPVAKSECPNQFANIGSRVAAGGLLQGGSDSQNAVDGNFGSFASLYGGGADSGADGVAVYSAPSSKLDLQVTAPSGLSFPAGTRAGAAAQLASGVAAQQQVTVTTYLGGVVQETFDGGTQTGSTEAAADRLYSYVTTKAYDAVQFSVLLSSAVSTERPQVKVYEFCG